MPWIEVCLPSVSSGLFRRAYGCAVRVAAKALKRKASFDQIDVKRINVVEPDGTIAMVVSNRADFPGSS